MTSARDTLLDKAVDHVAGHGMSDMSLRELAAGIGTSHRMLIYHFGSREGLVAAIVARMETLQRATVEQLAEEASTPAELVERQWEQLVDPALRPFERLFFEVLALALHGRPGTEGFLEQLTEPWLQVGAAVAERLEVATTPEEVRLGVAVIRGLLIDVLATGDEAAATAALQRFLDMWDRSRDGSRMHR